MKTLLASKLRGAKALASVIACSLALASFASHAADGEWRPLFNGTNLDGWYTVIGKKKSDDPNHLVQVHDGAIHMYKDAKENSEQPFGYISTDKEYENYHLRFQYKWGTKKFAPRSGPNNRRDAGTLYHVVGPDGVWPRSVECQVQENDVGDIFTVYTRVTTFADPTTTMVITNYWTNDTTGEVKSALFAKPVFLPPEKGGVPFTNGLATNIRRVVRNPMAEHDGWNTVEVVVRGNNAVHIINGVTNNIANDISQWVKNTNAVASATSTNQPNGAWAPLSKGRITLQLEGAEVLYRNVEIKSLENK